MNHRCYRGTRCVEREDGQGAQIQAPAGFCPPCTRLLHRALRDLPRLYTELDGIVGRPPADTGEHVSGTPTAPIPVRADVDACQREMVHEAVCWAESVADQRGIRMDTQSTRNSRPGAALQHATRFLGNTVTTLLDLDAQDHTGWLNGHRAVLTRTGLDGAHALLAVHQTARLLLGQTRLVHRLTAPCPRCERATLERADGSDTIDCTGCGRRYTMDEYEQLCGLFANRKHAA